jgi:hypothetical protein
VLGRNLSAVGKVVLALSVLLLGADSAMAYVGPGADVAFISYAMTLLAWVLAAFSTVLLWLCNTRRNSGRKQARLSLCGRSVVEGHSF